MDNPEIVAKKMLFLAWLPFLIITIFVLFFDLNPNHVSRYGALMVLFGIVGEYAIYSYKIRMLELSLSLLKEQVNPNYWVELSDNAKADLEGNYDHDGFWAYQLHATVAFGTITWGYGDIVSGWLHELLFA